MALIFACLSLPSLPSIHAQPLSQTGPFLADFPLTLESGRRTEAVGPFYYFETAESHETWALPPLLSVTRFPSVQSEEVNFLYPVMSYIRYGRQYRWQFFQLLSFSGGPTAQEPTRDRFTIFPFYFQQRSSDPTQNYTAYGPFYGHLKTRLFRDEISYVMFPAYSETRKGGVVTDNYLYPVFHLRHGDGVQGWQLWPFVGREHKVITTRTNGFGDVEKVPGHDDFFVLWPFFFDHHAGIGSDNPERYWGVIPAFTTSSSPKRDSTTVLWPFFSRIDDREQKYREWDAPWPLIEFARGEGKYTSRLWPFYGHAANSNLVSDFYLWPVYKFNRTVSAHLDRRYTRILFYLYTSVTDKNTENGSSRHRTALLPLYSFHRDLNGNRRLQVLSLLEPFMPENPNIEREYSPVYAFWRSEKNPKTGAASQSLLWNLYRHESTPDSTRTSACFGLWQRQTSPRGQDLRLCFIHLKSARCGAAPPGAGH